MVGLYHILTNVYVAESPDRLGEGEENVFLEDMADWSFVFGRQDGVDHV